MTDKTATNIEELHEEDLEQATGGNAGLPQSPFPRRRVQNTVPQPANQPDEPNQATNLNHHGQAQVQQTLQHNPNPIQRLAQRRQIVNDFRELPFHPQ